MHLNQEILQKSSVNLLMIDKWLHDGKISLEEVGELMPLIFHLDNTDLSVQYLNPVGCDLLGFSLDEAINLSTSFPDIIYHQLSLVSTKQGLAEFYGRHDFIRSYHDLVRLWYPAEQEYKLCLLTCKRSKCYEGLYTVSQPLEDLDYVSHKISRLVDEECFKLEQYHLFATLTEREREIIGLLANGLNNPTIAEHLFISRNTVEQHRKNINKKLGLKSFVGLLKYAQAFELI